MKLHFHPLAGFFISKFCLSPHIKLMINETKNTSENEWCFNEGFEKLPSGVILVFFTATSSLRNKIHVLQLQISLIQYNDGSKIVFCKIRKFYHLVIQKKKITAIGLNFDFFHLILMAHCLFTFHYANKYL